MGNGVMGNGVMGNGVMGNLVHLARLTSFFGS